MLDTTRGNFRCLFNQECALHAAHQGATDRLSTVRKWKSLSAAASLKMSFLFLCWRVCIPSRRGKMYTICRWCVQREHLLHHITCLNERVLFYNSFDHSVAGAQASTLSLKCVYEQQCLEYSIQQEAKGAMREGKQIVEHSQRTNGVQHSPPYNTTCATKGGEAIHGNAKSPPL